MYPHFVRTSAAVLLSLCATLAVAGEDASICKDPAVKRSVDVTAPEMSRAENCAPPEKVATPAPAGKGSAASAEQSAQKPPRKPDTAGWRRIMSGAGRT